MISKDQLIENCEPKKRLKDANRKLKCESCVKGEKKFNTLVNIDVKRQYTILYESINICVLICSQHFRLISI